MDVGSHTHGDDPVISVVIPVYNRRDVIAEVLASVFTQTDCPSYEVVVVDDASVDGTADAVAASGLPVRLVRHERNGGVARARRTGAEQARGAFLAYHDSDDFMLPGRLGYLAAHLAAHPEAGAVFANGVVERNGAPTGAHVVPAELARRLDGRRIDVRDVVRDGLPMYLQTALIRRRVYDAVGGVDPSLVRHADLELACRVVLGAPTLFLDVPVFRYQLHDANQTRDRLKLREGLVEVMRRLRTKHPEAIRGIGEKWFRRREARHLYRIARTRLRAGDVGRARSSILEAVELEPRSVRYRWLQLQIGWRRRTCES